MLEVKNIRKIYNPGTVQEKCLFDDFPFPFRTGSLYPWLAATAQAKRACST